MKVGATSETGMEILEIMSDFIKPQSSTHAAQDLLRTLTTAKISKPSVKPSWKSYILILNTEHEKSQTREHTADSAMNCCLLDKSKSFHLRMHMNDTKVITLNLQLDELAFWL